MVRVLECSFSTGVGSGRGARGACTPPPTFFIWGGGAMVCLCPPPHPQLLTPHFYFPLELYVYITLTNNYMAFFIYQLIILWTNWHRWLLVNNHISKYNSIILVLYRRYINYVSVCPPPPPPPHISGTFLRHWLMQMWRTPRLPPPPFLFFTVIDGRSDACQTLHPPYTCVVTARHQHAR